eukprot:FR737877.1.p1 GENE.FR737877.1~~FR737877.1.p1  ORF type:complete len:123 (+),score=6.85 FR737877.1:44-370(+)
MRRRQQAMEAQIAQKPASPRQDHSPAVNMMAATALTPMSVMDGPVDTDVYNRTMQKLLRPIAWVVLPGGIRCPVVPDENNMAAFASIGPEVGDAALSSTGPEVGDDGS